MKKEKWNVIPRHPDYEASDTGFVRSIKNGRIRQLKVRYEKRKNGYVRTFVQIEGKTRNIGRLVLMAFSREPLDNEECDHINRDGSDNRIENLRWVSRADNLLNRSNYGNSKYKGVSHCHTYYKRKDGSIGSSYSIRSQITIKGKRINLGNFDTEEQAHEAYKIAYKKYYGYEWMD